MNNYIELAKAWSKADFSVIPVNSDKTPAIRSWQEFQARPMTQQECEKYFKSCYGVALLSGGKKSVTIIDFDLKYSLTADLFDRYKEKIPNELLKKMYYQTTMSKGCHFIFTCSKIEPNQKLANRYTTEFEKHDTYIDYFNDIKTRSKALKMALNDSTRVIIETRGAGGYALISPTKGYEHKFGKIQEISEKEYDVLMEAARSFNEVIENKKDVRLEKYNEWELSPFTDFNERGDVISLLEDNGWIVVRGGSKKSVRFKRPGSSSPSSALFDSDSRVFNCFSTSTSLDVNRGYSPADLFIELECEGDTGVAFKKLVELDYGKQ